MNTYNPLQRAISAAWAELSSPDACQWYADRAWNDTLTTAEAFRRACLATIALGQFCRCILEDWLHQPTRLEVAVATAPIAALPQIKLPPAPSTAVQPAPIGDTPDPETPPRRLQNLPVAELRRLCDQRGIRWNRAAESGRHLNRREMLALLSATGE